MGYFCKCYAKKQAQLKHAKMSKLLQEKASLENLMVTGNTAELSSQYELINKKLDVFAMEKATSAIFRSKCEFVLGGHKCTKYFFAQEKRRYLEKNMKAVFREDNSLSTDPTTILN